jgi:hypothetical protein
VPATFVALDTLPLLSNGKVDVRALPVPPTPSPAEDPLAGRPPTPTEEALVAIWRAVLGLARVGRHDDFFDLGGHSLLATQVVSRVREVLKVDLPLRTLFEAPTIAQFADVVTEAQRRSTDASFAELPPLVRRSRGASPAM